MCTDLEFQFVPFVWIDNTPNHFDCTTHQSITYLKAESVRILLQGLFIRLQHENQLRIAIGIGSIAEKRKVHITSKTMLT